MSEAKLGRTLFTLLFSLFIIFWQLFILFSCCLGVGLYLRCFLPKEFSLLNKVLFSLVGGLFLVVLIPQNLVYLGMPGRISALLFFGRGVWADGGGGVE